MQPKCQFAGVNLYLPDQWVEITDTLPSGTPPTLAREDGYGALQFTIGIHESGKVPHFTRLELERLLYHFEDGHDFERQQKVVEFADGSSFGISCDYDREAEFVRVWYVTNGKEIAFITYLNSKMTLSDEELGEATAIAESVEFG